MKIAIMTSLFAEWYVDVDAKAPSNFPKGEEFLLELIAP